MTKTVDQREEDLGDGVTFAVGPAWDRAVAKVQNDITAPIFLKSGNVKTLADQYDKLQNDFKKNLEKKKDAANLFNATDSQFDKLQKELEGLMKEVLDIEKDQFASFKTRDEKDNVAAAITNYENNLKASESTAKEYRAVFDRWNKVNDSALKLMSDTLAKVKKEAAAAQAALNGNNGQLNALEGQMRKIIDSYNGTATQMNRQDIATAVRSFLTIFAKA